MPQHTIYDAAVAGALLEQAFSGWEPKPYVVRDDGVYQCEQHRESSPPGEAFDWTPAYDMTWQGAPNPMTAPMLPIPFTAADLAAFMLDGAGAMIPEALECPIGGRIEESPRMPADDDQRLRLVREALQNAYALAAQAVAHVGLFDHVEEARAHALLNQYDEANGLANEREGVFDWNATNDEKGLRRARAVASVAGLKAQAMQARSEAKSKWRDWRGAMVKALLAPAQTQAATPAPTNTQEQRQAERWQLCIDGGLTMPTDTFAQLPRGIGRVAGELGITRQALSQDLNAHRERLFGR